MQYRVADSVRGYLDILGVKGYDIAEKESQNSAVEGDELRRDIY